MAWATAEGVHPVAGLTGLHVTRYARQLQRAGLSSGSVARKLAAVSGWYAWLIRRASHLPPGYVVAVPGRPGPPET